MAGYAHPQEVTNQQRSPVTARKTDGASTLSQHKTEQPPSYRSLQFARPRNPALQLVSISHLGMLPSIMQRVDKAHEPKLKQAYDAARADETAGDFDAKFKHQLATLAYPEEDDTCDREPEPAEDETVQRKAIPMQLARTPGSISGPKSYGGLKNILYQLDAGGNIDFANPQQYFIGNPYPGPGPIVDGTSAVDVGTSVGKYGKGNRYQHFKEANTKTGKGAGGASPAGWTWHHLTAKHGMHLVNREVHRKHGHNGGVLLW